MTATIENTPTHSDNHEYGTDWASLESMLNDPRPNEGEALQEETTAEITSPQERAGSRIGNWLRRLAERIDTTAESAIDTKEAVRETLVSFGQAARRGAEAARSAVVDTGAAIVRGAEATRDAGVAVAHGAKEVGLTTVGLGVMGAESVAGAVKNQYNKGEEAGYQATTAALEFGRDKMSQAREWLQQKRDAALARKAARRAKWSARFNAVKNATTEMIGAAKDTVTGAAETAVDAGRNAIDRTKDAVTGTIEHARETVHVARAVGDAAIKGAIRAGSNEYSAHTDQNKL